MIFEAGINSSILRALKNKAGNMDPLDKYCVLLFDEIQIKSELSYETNQQRVCGYQDLGQLGRSLSVANRALVFMIRGLNTPWKELIAYYFCGQDMSSTHLKKIIIEIILDLQHVGLNVVATVCKQLTKYQEPLRELCDIGSQGSVYFLVGDKPIVTIFNVPDLLKRTRDVFVDYNLQFEVGKMAKFEHIQMLLDLDKKKHFKTLPKLKTEHFNLNDINIKENVEVAAMQFSSTVAAGLETLVLTKYAPHDVTYTAEFVSVMDDLFDSLNGNQLNMLENKKYRGVLMAMSSHMKFWSWLLVHLVNWKVIDKKTGKDETSSFDFIKGWQITIEAVMFLWGNLQGGRI
ncbi:hypothetical protein NQ318_001275 [Aromia moschata]|uniref:Uncharacterized protein n=1 Tax=Aromia moschata TaxID=1265417 RepID=A0AAV8ZHC5_9CUCU|nr:hypothetical protein NQ318_001275 [Aromia moschata]